MAKIISFINQKGGVGKTTSSVNVSSYLSQAGKFVLLVDLDPQGNATSGLGIDPRTVKNSLYSAMIGNLSVKDSIVETKEKGFDIIPATADLAGANIDLVEMENREYRLYDVLRQVRTDYDYIIIDSPPSLGLLTINGLVASDSVIIPVQAEYYALEGLGQLLETINLVKDNLQPNLGIMGSVVTLYDKRNRLARQVVREMRQHFPGKVFDSIIPRNVRLAEAPSFGQSISLFDGFNSGARAYKALANEIIGLE
ncbi:MAG: ParA family protein [Candidatus Moranbacteria bacterium]|nr:ParA family protein [Candidatus Moranbacteria bacterium]